MLAAHVTDLDLMPTPILSRSPASAVTGIGRVNDSMRECALSLSHLLSKSIKSLHTAIIKDYSKTIVFKWREILKIKNHLTIL